MVKEHISLREYSGKPWFPGSVAREYLEKLPVVNVDNNFKENETTFLLPRQYVFTFGLQIGITEPVTYFWCKTCPVMVKPHVLKHHMIVYHSTQENSSGNIVQRTSVLSVSSLRQKKNSHRNKKRIIPPPSVPPPPKFNKLDSSHRSCTVTSTVTSEAMLPPTLIPIESGFLDNMDLLNVNKSEESSIVCNMPPALNTEIPTSNVVLLSPVLNTSKIKEKSSIKSDKSHSSRSRRSRRSRGLIEYDPDKHCGVRDHSKPPCMRALTCAMHTITERRAVPGRSKMLDRLILEYKASRVKSKPSLGPITILPKQCSSKEVRTGFNLLNMLYNSDEKISVIENNNTQCDDELLSMSIKEVSTRISPPVNVLPRDNSCFPPTMTLSTSTALTDYQLSSTYGSELDQVSVTTTTSILKATLTQPQITKLSELPSQSASMIYSLHPKPLTMSTAPLRRVGNSFIVQQAPRLDRQRTDLKTVVAQHKQLKITSTKSVTLLNSNHNKQSLLKSSIKSNVKINTFKRPEKSSLNDIKM